MPITHIRTLRDGASGKEKVELIETEAVPAWEDGAELQVVGQPYPRVEGEEKVTGRARYSCDVRLPGQLYAAVLRSPHPHARIRRIDISKAEALPGVHAVLCTENAPEIEWYDGSSYLFDRTVRFVGEEVAAVAAESEEIAEDALRLIDVEYEPLPHVTDMWAALRDDAAALHEGGNQAG